MNIIENHNFSTDKPSIIVLKKTDKSKIISVGLFKNGMLKKHKTALETMLIVIEGSVVFEINGEKLHLQKGEIFEIPINVEHEVKGNDTKNVFLLIQEL